MTTTITTAVDAVLATDLSDATDRLILADWLEEHGGVADAGPLRRRGKNEPHNVRWMIWSDVPDVVESESARGDAWTEEQVRKALAPSTAIGMVVEDWANLSMHWKSGSAIGHMIYVLHRRHVEVVRLAVHPDHRGLGVARCMTEKLTHKLNNRRRTRVTLRVPTADLDTLCAMLRCGWRVAEECESSVLLDININNDENNDDRF